MTFPKNEEYYAEIKRYTRLLKSFPGNAHVLKARASCRALHSDWKRAVRDYKELAAILPNNAEILDKLGQVCVHAGLYEQAITACTRAIVLDPKNPLPYMHRAWAYRKMKRWDASAADYTRAIALQPDLLIAYLYRAVAYKDSDKKTADLLEALKLNDKLSLLHYMLGREYEKADKNELAIESFTRALKIAPEWYDIYRERYARYAAIGEYQAAIDDLSCFIDHQPSKASVIDWLAERGNLHCKIGEYDKALEEYSKAIQYEKRYGGDFPWIIPGILQQRGKCYQALHEEEKAQADFKKAAKIISIS